MACPPSYDYVAEKHDKEQKGIWLYKSLTLCFTAALDLYNGRYEGQLQQYNSRISGKVARLAKRKPIVLHSAPFKSLYRITILLLSQKFKTSCGVTAAMTVLQYGYSHIS